MLFSQRKGLKPLSKVIQKNSIDQELRTGLWNCYHIFILERASSKTIYQLCRIYWLDYFKWPIDNLSDDAIQLKETIRNYFFDCKWEELYDFLEFTLQANKDRPPEVVDGFRLYVNQALEREFSAYRFVGDVITEITSEVEIEAIQSALEDPSVTAGLRAHINRALDHLSDRKNPDYRNSIKESISAVEALCRVIVKNPKATLGEALKTLDPYIPTHTALREAFSKLYGYTSDDGGIRHAMLDEKQHSFSDAKFMLVTCSAFINYLLGKCAEKGYTIG